MSRCKRFFFMLYRYISYCKYCIGIVHIKIWLFEMSIHKQILNGSIGSICAAGQASSYVRLDFHLNFTGRFDFILK